MRLASVSDASPGEVAYRAVEIGSQERARCASAARGRPCGRVSTHPPPRSEQAMRKLSLAVLPVAAAIAAGAIAVAPGSGSSHREAPLTALDPTADDTDLYAFVAPDAPQDLTVVANWIPFEDPAGGPNFYRFDDRAKYYVNVDNTGDGRYDVRYRFKFRTKVRNEESFLYAVPQVTSIDDPDLNVIQTYSVERLRYSTDHWG